MNIENIIFKTKQFFKNWIYPAYSFKNYFFNRYDLIKLNQIKRTEYCDVVQRILYANMNLITHFIQKQEPQKYVLWYGQGCHKYGQNNSVKMYLPQYKDKYIMDIIKQIYKWWTIDYPNKQKQFDYILSFWCDYIKGQLVFDNKGKFDCPQQLKFDKSKCPKKIQDIKDADWVILNKYFKRQQLLNDGVVFEKMNQLQFEIDQEKQKYLHLAIEVRPFLWI